MLLTCSPGHELAQLRSIRLAQLNGQRYIGFTRELPIRQKIDQFLRRHGVAVDIILEFDNIEYVKKALEIGSGVALLPEPMLKREVESGTLAAIPLSGLRFVRPLSVIYRKSPKLSPAAAGFIRLIRRPEDLLERTGPLRERRRTVPSNHSRGLRPRGTPTALSGEDRGGVQ